MSYIYEALKRAEDENAKGVAVPRAVRRPAFFVARPRWWLWGLIAVLGANAVLLVALVFLRGPSSPDVTTATTTSTESAAGPVAAPPRDADAPRVTPAAETPEPPAVATAPPTAAPPARTVAPAPRAAPPSARPATPAPRAAQPPATTATPPLPRVDPTRPPPSSTVVRESGEAQPGPPTPPAPVAPVSPGGAVVAPPASAPAAPPATDLPRLQIQVVVYSEVPAERLVFIDGRRYAEGARIDAETVVERITPEGAIVTRRGERLTLTSGRP